MKPSEYIEWGLWSFGETFADYMRLDADSIDLKHAWNKLHSDIYKFNEKHILKHFDMKKLIKFWRKVKNAK